MAVFFETARALEFSPTVVSVLALWDPACATEAARWVEQVWRSNSEHDADATE